MAKRRGKARKNEFDEVLENIDSKYASVDVVEPRRDEAIARLVEIGSRKKIDDHVVGAAVMLCLLRAPEAYAVAVRVLRHQRSDERWRFLDRLTSTFVRASFFQSDSNLNRDFLLGDETLVKTLVSQLDHLEWWIVEAAIEVCGAFQLPGASEKFVRLLSAPYVKKHDRLFLWLSKGELIPEVLDRALEQPVGNILGIGQVFKAFADSADESQRHAARERLKRELELLPPDKGTRLGGNRSQIQWRLANTSDGTDLPWWRELFEIEVGYQCIPALAALAKFSDNGRELAIACLDDPERKMAFANAASWAFQDSGDQQMVQLLNDRMALADEKELRDICKVLMAIDGDDARRAVTGVVDRLSPKDAEHFRNWLDPNRLDQLLDAVAAAGVIPETLLEQAASKLRKRVADNPKARFPNLIDVFVEAECGVHFDTESSDVPCPHDDLIRDFAAASHGCFAPEQIEQQVRQRFDGDPEAHYTLGFFHGGHRYQCRLEWLGDWYDTSMVMKLINPALEHSDCPQRFVSVETGGQDAAFLFAETEKLVRLAEDFGMRLHLR